MKIKTTVDTRYKVSECGIVFSVRTKKMKKISTQRDISGKYKRVALGKKHYLVHRLVALAFIPNPLNLPQVNHKDGDMLNNHVTNLEWVTAGDNQRHAYETNLKTLPKGVLNGRHVLTEKEVLSIYSSLLVGTPVKVLAELYGVTTGPIGRIKNKKAWNHLLQDLPDISVRMKTPPLTNSQTLEVERLIRECYTFKETVNKIDFNITQDQFYRLKSL